MITYLDLLHQKMVGIAEDEVVVCVEEATGVTVEVCLFEPNCAFHVHLLLVW